MKNRLRSWTIAAMLAMAITAASAVWVPLTQRFIHGNTQTRIGNINIQEKLHWIEEKNILHSSYHATDMTGTDISNLEDIEGFESRPVPFEVRSMINLKCDRYQSSGWPWAWAGYAWIDDAPVSREIAGAIVLKQFRFLDIRGYRFERESVIPLIVNWKKLFYSLFVNFIIVFILVRLIGMVRGVAVKAVENRRI